MVAIPEPAFEQHARERTVAMVELSLRLPCPYKAIAKAKAALDRLLADHNEPAIEPPLVPIADLLTDQRACETLESMGVYLLGHLADRTYAELFDGVLIGHGTLTKLRTELRKIGSDFKAPS